MRGTERRSGGNPWASHRQPRRSYSTAERHHGGDRGPARVADIGEVRENWTVVRSRKRKATELERRGRDRSKGSGDQRGAAIGYGQHRLQGSDRGLKDDSFDRQREEDKVRIGDG